VVRTAGGNPSRPKNRIRARETLFFEKGEILRGSFPGDLAVGIKERADCFLEDFTRLFHPYSKHPQGDLGNGV